MKAEPTLKKRERDSSVVVPQGYKRLTAQMNAIFREFNDGASVRSLSRKHSLPSRAVEFVLCLKMREWKRRLNAEA